MMGNNKKGKFEALFYNNKFLMVFSVVVAVLLWAMVKINYSAEVTRNISDIKINMNTTLSQSGEFEAFMDEADLYADVVVSGKAYDINQYALSKDDITVETSSAYIDSAGYKVLTLSAKLADSAGVSGVEVISLEPSTITVYYDRKTTETFNVEARLNNEIESIVDSKLTVGQPVPSMNTVDVTGPATILNKLTKVYFDAQINERDLPLSSTKEVPAEISYQLDRVSESKYLVCEGISDESNPATVTIPVYVTKEVETAVKFVNQPAIYSEKSPSYKINPKTAKILYNSNDEEKTEKLFVGTIDFSTVSNKNNVFEFMVDEKLGANVVDKSIQKFTVNLDMSDMSKLVLEEIPGKVVLLNQDENYTYSIDYEASNLSAIEIIGPKKSLDKITAEDLQIEINVSSLSMQRSSQQIMEVSNISIQNDSVDDCWVYGKYTVAITVTPK